jgi:hypothetical protein
MPALEAKKKSVTYFFASTSFVVFADGIKSQKKMHET